MLSRVADELESGSVVVMHDGIGPGALRDGCGETVALVEPLAELVRSRGWEPGALGEGAAFSPPLGMRPPRARDRVIGSLMALSVPRSARRKEGTDGFELDCIEEDELVQADATALRKLLAGGITREREGYRARGWRTLRPAFRTLVRARGRIVGQQSVFPLETDPPRRAFGLGDVVVSRRYRGRGIARRLIEAAVERCWERGAEVILTDTVAVRPVFLSLGFSPVPRFAWSYERDGACHWHPNWLAAVRHPEPQARLRLAEGDF
jgi:GNAT superfamily N-acetyltransferase